MRIGINPWLERWTYFLKHGEGEQIGIQKTVVNALKSKSGLDVETIHQITGVSKDEIRKLQREAKDI
jgi:uridylate kinase